MGRKSGLGMKARIILLTLILTTLFSVSAAAVRAATVTQIADQLICQCGCTLVLSNCTHGECMSRDAMLTLITQKLEQGQTQEQIIGFFVAQYGEQVLASPSKRGFNLTAWIAPFVAILAGGALVYVAIRKWVRRGKQQVEATVVTREEEEEYRQRLEKELQQFGERGYR
ncbi:MAG: cytochrome c-type biogenesis protein CcmH [Chloroflexi bacterium]|nr:cytochrome c-type biogenesis protein CcmH [Chloroflexota bacterium]